MRKKRFFRKLSAVLSAAMLVTSVNAPAAYGAFAGDAFEPAEAAESSEETADASGFVSESREGSDKEYLDSAKELFYFKVNKDGKTATLTKYNKPDYVVEGTKYGDLVIPEKVKDAEDTEYEVTVIGDSACEDLIIYEDGIVIPDTVTEIGALAFAGCYKLKGDLTIPDSVTTIGEKAFWQCDGLDGELTLGKNVETIGNLAFCKCDKLKGGLVIPDSVVSIGDDAFYGCLGFDGELKLGTGLQTIGARAFDALGGLKFKGGLTLSDNVISIGERAFYQCETFDGKLVLGKNIQTIGEEAFSGCKGFTGTLTIPDSVTKIGANAFLFCSGFTGTLKVGKGLMDCDETSFMDCKGIKRVSNNSVAEIDLAKMSNDLNVTWADEKTGAKIKTIKQGTAVRSDYSPADEPQEPEEPGEEETVSGNEPSDYATEVRSYEGGKFVVGYCHKTPFFGKAKPGVESFGKDFAVLYDKKIYKVSKIKYNKKTMTISILGLEGADKDVVKQVKKATKGAGGLPFKFSAYTVSNKDSVLPKMNKKDGSVKYVKINLFGKYYKATPVEFDFDKTKGIIKFKGSNLKGSFKI